MRLNVSIFNSFAVGELINLGVKLGNTIIYNIFLRMLYKHSSINI